MKLKQKGKDDNLQVKDRSSQKFERDVDTKSMDDI